MNKNELVNAVSKEAGLTKVDATKAIDAVMRAVTQALVKEDDVRLVGFGTFAVAKRAATEGRNPQTGAKIQIPATRVPRFRAGKLLKEAVAR